MRGEPGTRFANPHPSPLPWEGKDWGVGALVPGALGLLRRVGAGGDTFEHVFAVVDLAE
ncbi:hypothetical protein HOV93_23020 [Planctomycetes bacterium FF15]|uniref:Uncharacterized protein n=1 Tax=Bremerella alba TaxID=980252 RepID=A0A7V9A773_9BACT|nr:hypothetical protein [Bremerella alba]